MPEENLKADLRSYLQTVREAVLWKLDGLSEYDARRPLTRTGTNLLGLVKHLAHVEFGYFGAAFGRDPEEDLPGWSEDADPNDDMWAKPDESREAVVALYRRAWAWADATIGEKRLEDRGRVPWWPADRAEPTLHKVLVHVIAETNRHAGHADIVRELVDGAAGLRAGNDNLASGDAAWWAQYRDKLERVAKQAGSVQ
ncbi:MAG: DinB family protein [Segniliparus sp.]|uniref:DinB family protein n=1 Tax=Segniliparus sp. TaxID=2804064 RepID=UPI003F30A7B6